MDDGDLSPPEDFVEENSTVQLETDDNGYSSCSGGSKRYFFPQWLLFICLDLTFFFLHNTPVAAYCFGHIVFHRLAAYFSPRPHFVFYLSSFFSFFFKISPPAKVQCRSHFCNRNKIHCFVGEKGTGQVQICLLTTPILLGQLRQPLGMHWKIDAPFGASF